MTGVQTCALPIYTDGRVTAVTLANAGSYTVPTGTTGISTTGGAGAGATMNVTYLNGGVAAMTLIYPGNYALAPVSQASTTVLPAGGSGLTITLTRQTFANGTTVRFSKDNAAVMPGGLVVDRTYYVINTAAEIGRAHV